jgi:benzil reductase ((S)-benzoin forming)
VSSHLVFISGASSGIGAALARAVPEADARVVNISRGAAPRTEHFVADLSDPAGWSAVAALFEREMKAFEGDRISFVHCAGTLTPIGPAGAVPAEPYAAQVLLNSAAPQVLGDAFVRASRDARCECHLVIISSGAASNVYEGWSAYGAGKAAVDQWVRTVGAEQRRAGGRCRVLAVAPGIVETPMQEEIRRTAESAFPDLERFVGFHEDGTLRDADEVAADLWALLERDLDNGSVLDLRE